MWVRGATRFPQGYPVGVTCRNLLNDLRWLRSNWQAQKTPHLVVVPWRQLPREVLTLFTRDHYDTFVADDPRPGFAEIQDRVRPVARRLARLRTKLALSLTPFSTHRVRARRALEQANCVLFVCKGNVCRSPFAQRLATTLFPDNVHISSAGYYPESGRGCPPEAVKAAAEMGVDLAPHRSRVVSAKMMDEADVVFVFDEDNYLTVRDRFAWAMPKVHFLGVLGGRGRVIRDPYGGTGSAFRTAYQAIHRSLTSTLRPSLRDSR